MTESRVFRCRPEAVASARTFVRGALGALPPRLIEAAELMSSELASNCVRHAQTDFEMTVVVDEEIRVEVRDVSRGRPTVRSPGLAEPSGRGLRIVQALSDAWGVTPSADGKIVWFELYIPDESSFGATAAAACGRGAGTREQARSAGTRRGSGDARARGGGGKRASSGSGRRTGGRVMATLPA